MIIPNTVDFIIIDADAISSETSPPNIASIINEREVTPMPKKQTMNDIDLSDIEYSFEFDVLKKMRTPIDLTDIQKLHIVRNKYDFQKQYLLEFFVANAIRMKAYTKKENGPVKRLKRYDFYPKFEYSAEDKKFTMVGIDKCYSKKKITELLDKQISDVAFGFNGLMTDVTMSYMEKVLKKDSLFWHKVTLCEKTVDLLNRMSEKIPKIGNTSWNTGSIPCLNMTLQNGALANSSKVKEHVQSLLEESLGLVKEDPDNIFHIKIAKHREGELLFILCYTLRDPMNSKVILRREIELGNYAIEIDDFKTVKHNGADVNRFGFHFKRLLVPSEQFLHTHYIAGSSYGLIDLTEYFAISGGIDYNTELKSSNVFTQMVMLDKIRDFEKIKIPKFLGCVKGNAFGLLWYNCSITATLDERFMTRITNYYLSEIVNEEVMSIPDLIERITSYRKKEINILLSTYNRLFPVIKGADKPKTKDGVEIQQIVINRESDKIKDKVKDEEKDTVNKRDGETGVLPPYTWGKNPIFINAVKLSDEQREHSPFFSQIPHLSDKEISHQLTDLFKSFTSKTFVSFQAISLCEVVGCCECVKNRGLHVLRGFTSYREMQGAFLVRFYYLSDNIFAKESSINTYRDIIFILDQCELDDDDPKVFDTVGFGVPSINFKTDSQHTANLRDVFSFYMKKFQFDARRMNHTKYTVDYRMLFNFGRFHEGSCMYADQKATFDFVVDQNA